MKIVAKIFLFAEENGVGSIKIDDLGKAIN